MRIAETGTRANDSVEITATPVRIHIGGMEPRDGWKILNIQAGPGVDFVGDCSEAHWVLISGGFLRISVPDLDMLCRWFLDETLGVEARFDAMRMMFGGQLDPYDFHRAGLNFGLLGYYLKKAGFREMTRVRGFDIFHDDSTTQVAGQLVSLNIEAKRARGLE